jgi:hypothetical protein
MEEGFSSIRAKNGGQIHAPLGPSSFGGSEERTRASANHCTPLSKRPSVNYLSTLRSKDLRS